MSNIDTDFSKIVDSKEWKISLSEEEKVQGFSAIFESVYAVAGIAVLPNIKQAVSSWTEFQGLMLNYRNQPEGNTKKDLYLIFIVPFIDSSQLATIETMINDTHVCRKICIEQKGRSLNEALNDCGFITTIHSVLDSSERNLSNQASNQGLSEEILNDLRTRSEKTIFEKLLDNSYYK